MLFEKALIVNINFAWPLLLYLRATAPSLIIIEHPQSMSVQSRTEVTFNCEATSRDYGNVTYLWQRVDGRELDVSRTTGINSNKLTISNVMSGDAGSYVCVASNKDAEIISRNILHIKGGYR